MGTCPHKRMGVSGLKYNSGDNSGALLKNVISQMILMAQRTILCKLIRSLGLTYLTWDIDMGLTAIFKVGNQQGPV